MVDESRDPNFPTGEWTGTYTQFSRRFRQDLFLSFRDGVVTGAGTDPIGLFKIRGGFAAGTRRVWWTKTYPGRHDVAYQGVCCPDGIKGEWTISTFDRGAFHLWPVGRGEGAVEAVEEELEQPVGVSPGSGPQR